MDRDSIARERRRAEVLEALELERDREAALRDQIGDTVLDEERARIDGEALSRLEPEDAELVREILHADDGLGDSVDDEWEEFLTGLGEDLEPADEAETAEDEVARLTDEIAESQARQQALERFLEALADDAPEPQSG